MDAVVAYAGGVEGIEPEDIKKSIKEQENSDINVPAVIGVVLDRYERAKTAKLSAEARHLAAYEDYRGIVNSQRNLRRDEKSQVFVKIAKSKTLAAYGQINEVLFGSGKFPIGVFATERPDGVAKYAHVAKEDALEEEPTELDPELDFGYPGDGKRENEDIPPMHFLGGLRQKFLEGVAKFKPGPAPTDEPQVSPAKAAAIEMQKTIKDQLTETKAAREFRKSNFELCLYGTGIIKGPYNTTEIVPSWRMAVSEDGETEKEYEPKTKLVPAVSHVSVWNAFPDAGATDSFDLDHFIERHKMTKGMLRRLRKMPYFNIGALNTAISQGPNYTKQHYENSLGYDDNDDQVEETRYEVLEYWGTLDKSIAMEMGMEGVEELTELDEVQVNIWVCNNQLLRMVINPFEPERLPYHCCPYERDPHEFFGVGVPENMADSTMLMNGHARMAIDNLALSGNLIFDIDESALVPGQPTDIYPGKIFRRQSGAPGQAIHGIKFPSTTTENLAMFDKWRQIADEETGIPSYSHGQTRVQSTTRTAAGMSMLMGAAALNIKTVVKNIDDYHLRPIGEGFYYWNMQFNPDVRIQGDLKVKALGTDALMQKEVRSQRIQQFLQLTGNPMLAPWINPGPLLKEYAYSQDLDPEEVINDLDQAKVIAEIIGKASAMGGPPGPPGQGGPLGPSNPMAGGMEEPGGSTGTGNGNIGPANVKMPGESGFSGNQGDNGGNIQAPPTQPQ